MKVPESDAATERVSTLELPPGEVLSQRWRIERVLGRGPNGTVHLAVDLVQNQAAALKLLTRSSKSNAPFAARFERECRELARLEHPYLARTFGFGWRDQTPFVVSRFVDAPPLDAWLKSRTRASPEELLTVARQLCEAVSFIHQNALVHRAIKPNNIRMYEAGDLILLDLGTARDFERPVLELPDFDGEPHTLAPEQLNAQPVDHRADIYALGVVLFKLATGRWPFDAPRLSDLIKAQLSAPPPSAAALYPDIPSRASRVFARAMAKSPVDRFATAPELLSALEEAYSADPSESRTGLRPPDASNRIGRYRLVRKLATGGMAEVFLAAAEGMLGFEKQVALKRILPSLAEDPKFVERFLKEARWVARLNHPNIAQIFDCGQADGTYYIAMELVDGPNLRALANHLARKGPTPVPVLVRLIAYAAEGLGYAHELKDSETGQPAGVIHRDVSPENILISRNGAVKVVDFGIAKAIDSKTRSMTIRGKYAYLAPEQIRSELADPRTDVYSLAVVLYELLAGQRPYNATTEQATLRAILDDSPIPIRQRRADVPGELERVLACALEKDPANRFATCREFGAALQKHLAAAHGSIGTADVAQLVTDYDVGPGTVSIVIADPNGVLALGPGVGDRPTHVRSPSPVVSEPKTLLNPREPVAERPALQAAVPTGPVGPPLAAAPFGTTGRIGELWRSNTRRRAFVAIATGLLGAVVLVAAIQGEDEDAQTSTRPGNRIVRAGPRAASVSSGGGGGGGGGSGGEGGGELSDGQRQKLARARADRRGGGGQVRFEAPAKTEVILEGASLGHAPAPVAMKPGSYTAVFITGSAQVRRGFTVPPEGNVVVRP